MNKVLLMGSLGKNPEIKYSKSGVAICTFSIATSENVKQGSDWKKVTEWHNIVTLGTTAENCAKYLVKGSKVFVEGKIKTRSYNSKEGVEKKLTEIVAGNVTFVSKLEKQEIKRENDPLKDLYEKNKEAEDADQEDLPF